MFLARPYALNHNSVNDLKPRLNEGTFIFLSGRENLLPDTESILVFRELEGYTHVISTLDAKRLKISYDKAWSWITLDLHSSLSMVGLTAAFSSALSRESIPCNVVAGFHHDHLFVPYELADRALSILNKVSITSS